MDAPPAWIGARELRELGVAGAVSALERFLRSGVETVAPQRAIADFGQAQLLSMPAWSSVSAGVKLVTVQPENPLHGLPLIHSVYVLLDAQSLAPMALIDGTELTALRTSSVSALATRRLAREDSSRLVLFGSGVQAEAHVHAMRAVRALERVRIVGRSRSADELVKRLRTATELDIARADATEVREADIVCTCTTASEPLFDGSQLARGAHVNAIGSYQPHTREVDSATVARSSVFVEDHDAVLHEAGDLRIPMEAGEFDADAVVGDLRAIVTRAACRGAPEEITLFKSVGVAWQDLAVATAAWKRSEAQG